MSAARQVRLQEIPSGSIYKKNRLKIEQNCRLFWDIFSSAIMNDLFMTFTSGLKMDAKCVYQQWNWITVANYFGTPPADWVHGYLFWAWRMDLNKEVPTYLLIVKNWSGHFSLNSTRVRALGWPLLGIFSGFFRFFFFFLGESVGQITYREYIVFRGSNIPCSLATSHLDQSTFSFALRCFRHLGWARGSKF